MTKFIGMVLVLSFLIVACINITPNHLRGNGNLSSTEITLSSFEKVNIRSGKTNVRFHASNEYRAVIKIDSNLEEFVVMDIKNKVLDIYLKRGQSYSYRKFDIDIFCPSITGVTLYGSGSFEGTDKIVSDTFDSIIYGSGKISGEVEADNVNIRMSGSGNISHNIICNNISVEMPGSGNITITGEGDIANIRISGSGNFNGIDFRTNDTNIRLSGSAKIKIWALEKITANVSGSGNIRYRGNPLIDFSGSGSGKINRE